MRSSSVRVGGVVACGMAEQMDGLLSEMEPKFEDPGDPFRIRESRSKEEQLARRAVRRALKSGKLLQAPCQQTIRVNGKDYRCGRMPTEAHHLDYARENWLNVVWLCKEHHDARRY